MHDKIKKEKSKKKDRRDCEDLRCYDVCDPCMGYYLVDDCGCRHYYVDPCGC